MVCSVVLLLYMEDVRKRFAEYKKLRKLHKEVDSRPQDGEERTTSEDGLVAEEKLNASTFDHQNHETESVTETTTVNSVSTDTPPVVPPSLPPSPPSTTCTTILKVLLWILLWGFFIEVGFGAVFFITSLLYFIITSLRGSRRKPWEPSAYSVFNRNFEAIDGTLSAEQFERELRHGPLSVQK